MDSHPYFQKIQTILNHEKNMFIVHVILHESVHSSSSKLFILSLHEKNTTFIIPP